MDQGKGNEDIQEILDEVEKKVTNGKARETIERFIDNLVSGKPFLTFYVDGIFRRGDFNDCVYLLMEGMNYQEIRAAMAAASLTAKIRADLEGNEEESE